MRVYSHVKISEISNVCIESEVNNLTHHQYIIKFLYTSMEFLEVLIFNYNNFYEI